MDRFRGRGFWGCNCQKYSIEYSTTRVSSHTGALVYIANGLVVVVVSSKQVVKPLTILAMVQPEVLHLLECLLEHRHYIARGN